MTFPRLLRRAGLPVTVGQNLAFLEALQAVDVGRREQVFHAARSMLVFRREDLALFEQIFELFWQAARGGRRVRPQRTPRAPRHDSEPERPFNIATYMAYKARRFDREVEIVDRSATFSPTELLQQKDFSELDPEELGAVKRLIQEMRWRVAERRTRRRVAARRGRSLDLRRTLAAAARRGGVALELRRRRRQVKERPLVLLADVSGSMEQYSRLLLLFAYSLAHSARSVESFVFGTRLSRLTPQLAIRNIDVAVDSAARQVIDWAGGTRIADSLGAFNRRWGRRVLRRGAVVLLISDGWERGDAERLAREMRHLQHRCHRLIWLNPLLGKESYRPAVGGMSAALPYVDDFLPLYNLQSLEQLGDHLRALPRRCARGFRKEHATHESRR